MAKTLLTLVDASGQALKKRTLSDTTFEERQDMSTRQLIELMGDLWILHPEHKPRGKAKLPAIPVPNLAVEQAEPFDLVDAPRTFWQLVGGLWRWLWM